MSKTLSKETANHNS